MGELSLGDLVLAKVKGFPPWPAKIGAVSDDELLELLHLALSSDTSNTVKRARELMRSRIDPMQLVSQLANLIVDILAGKCQRSACEVNDKLFSRHISNGKPPASSPQPPNPIDCGAACTTRCSKLSWPNLCNRACGSCCRTCHCVPPGTSGNYEACPGYFNLTTHNNTRKCP